MFDLVVGASSIYGGSWLEGAGAVYAENEALRWVADLAGLPPSAGGVFVPVARSATCRPSSRPGVARGGTAEAGGRAPGPRVAAHPGAHSSIVSACEVMDADFVGVEADSSQRLSGAALRRVLEAEGPDTFFAVVATGGTTNFGIVDDLASVAEVCREYGLWLHVDGAYGGAGLAAPSVRHLYAGIEHADSFIVDPHKWLFAPFDCCALLYREPALARAAHTQQASYLDVLTEAPDWNPTDYSIGLTRRARGLPFWFSLATHGTRAYSDRDRADAGGDALRRGRDRAGALRRGGARARPLGGRVPAARLVAEDYQAWCDRLLADQVAFVVPTRTRVRRSPASRSSTPAPARTTSPPSSTRWRDRSGARLNDSGVIRRLPWRRKDSHPEGRHGRCTRVE